MSSHEQALQEVFDWAYTVHLMYLYSWLLAIIITAFIKPEVPLIRAFYAGGIYVLAYPFALAGIYLMERLTTQGSGE